MSIALVVAAVSLGTGLRLHDLGTSTIGHIEIYVPGIDLPYELSDPRPRFSISSILTGTVAAEPHPPAYYLFMLGWTRCFGTSAIALRLPSVLFGAGSILLLYLIGIRVTDRPTALLAATLLALNGHQLFWAQLAKNYSMAVFLGLLSTFWLLVAAESRSRWRPLVLGLYGAATLSGLATVVYFWPLFLTQLLWSLRGRWSERSSASDILRVQTLIFVLASPLLALVAFQGRRPSYIETGLADGILQFLEFGFLFEPDDFAVPPTTVAPLLATGVVLLAIMPLAARVWWQSERHAGSPSSHRWPRWLTPVAAVAAAGVIVVFAIVAREHDPSRTPYILACAAIPVLLAVLDVLLQRQWARLQAWGLVWNRRWPQLSGAQNNSLILLLAVVPAALIAAASITTPLFVSSGVMLFSPYLILTLAAGLTALLRHPRRVIAVTGGLLLLAVLGVHALSTVRAQQRVRHPLDYKRLAEQWVPRIQASDLIFTRRHWALTPIFYYLNGQRYHFVGDHYADAARRASTNRVWVLAAEGMPTSPDMEQALSPYQPRETVEALRLSATLYQRRVPAEQ